MVRRATAHDVDAISRLIASIEQTWRAWAGPTFTPLTLGEIEAVTRIRLTAPRQHVLVAEDGANGSIAGVCAFGPESESPNRSDANERSAHLSTMYVAPGSDASTATHLCNEAIGVMAAAGYNSVRCWVYVDDEVSCRFYERKGWRPTGRTGNSLGLERIELRRFV